MGGKRRGGLSDEDRALWERVKTSVTPLHPVGPEPFSPQPIARQTPPAPRPKRKKPPPAPIAARPVNRKPAPPQAAADRKEARAIAAGKIAIDARLDLHGMRQGEAHQALIGFLHGAQLRGHRLVLVITGRGNPETASGRFHVDAPRGVLRTAVPLWLAEPRLQSLVVGWSPAHRRHGGDGALYVRLRRPR